jgi:hypothetical protein
VTHARSLAPIILALACAACARSTSSPSDVTTSRAPAADSITLALYHMDELGGTACNDAGPDRLNGTAGVDTRTDFGRFGSARAFTNSIESWIYVPASRELDSQHLTVEAWISPEQLSLFEDATIAGRWSEYANEQSWLFSIVGQQSPERLTQIQSPGFHRNLIAGATSGRLMFAFQPAAPVPRVVFFSATEIPLQRWTHVAVTHDGAVVRFFINGRLDAQFASLTSIRPSPAPLLIGNYFDTRKLSNFSGDLKAGDRVSHAPVYAFQGMMDELRISSQARSEFDPGR